MRTNENIYQYLASDEIEAAQVERFDTLFAASDPDTKNKMLEAATLLLSAWKISSPWKASEKSTKKVNEMKYRSRNARSRRL